MSQPIKVVVDTNVLMEGLTKQGGAASLIIDAVQLVLELAAGGYP